MLEILRLLVVAFFAGAGYQIGSASEGTGLRLGALNGTALGVVLGSGIGYVLGGVLGRRTATAAETTRRQLREVSAETLVAGAVGVLLGSLLAAAVAWPVFFLPQDYLALPLFGFVVIVLGYLGFQLAAAKRDGILSIFGRGGAGARPVAAAALPRLVDSSVAIDGRILDVVRAGFLHGTMLVAAPVLAELQGLADAGDDVRRAKGRRGLEVLAALKREPGVDVTFVDDDVPQVAEVDAKLVRLCLDGPLALLTLDANLAKVAQLAGVQVLNLHALALALRPPVAAGDEVDVQLLKAGKEAGQAIGYLDDGSMVVVERARERIGREVSVRVSSVLTTANGRLVFGRLSDAPAEPESRPRAGLPIPPATTADPGSPTPAAMPTRRDR